MTHGEESKEKELLKAWNVSAELCMVGGPYQRHKHRHRWSPLDTIVKFSERSVGLCRVSDDESCALHAGSPEKRSQRQYVSDLPVCRIAAESDRAESR